MFNRDMVPAERNDVCDGLCGTNRSRAPGLQHANQRYYAEVPALALDEQSQLIEQVIRFAFETLGAGHLEVRVHCAEQERFCAIRDSRNARSIYLH